MFLRFEKNINAPNVFLHHYNGRGHGQSIERAMKSVVRYLRTISSGNSGDARSDAELLAAFLETHDSAAFEVLFRRHASMVLAVCRRILGHSADAEDALQATFLILVRRSAAIRRRASVGSWLYGVACRTARRALVLKTQRRTKELLAPYQKPDNEALDPNHEELLARLDAELVRLPEKYRVPVVLCELEGKSRKEAARLLGLAEGTLSWRLARARKLLARRLRRHGAVLPAIGLAALLSTSASAAVPAALFQPTFEAGLQMASGEALPIGLVSAPVMALTEGVLRDMLLNRVRLIGIAAFTVMLGAAVAGWSYRVAAAQPLFQLEVAVASEPALALEELTDEISLEAMPAVVVKTVPVAGSDDVDAKLTEIKVTFSKDMTDKSWSWSTVSKESFPEVDGQPKYLADRRTCVLPVKLVPGKTYGIWLNSEKFGNFKSADGRPAVPYLLVFKTKK